MTRTKLPSFLALTVILLLTIGPVRAQYVRHMNLRQLCENARSIFRGTVLASTSGTVEAGGGEIPTITYRVRVDEAFQGVGESGDVEIRMVDPKMAVQRSGSKRSVPLLKGLPQIKVGEAYLFFLTRPGSVGLSTTVGLGQGCFHVVGGEEGTAVNEFGNAGLFKDMTELATEAGPIAYRTLANEIRRLLGAQ